ncbi:forkhead box protein N1 isoform X2 [Corythoichthys intestinalis]|nr:forkhead box protein N1 isoform X2 [Corythoichthys intestinalis]
MSDAPTFSTSKEELKPSNIKAEAYTSHKALVTSCCQVEKTQTIETQQDRNLLTSSHTPVSRRHSTDGTVQGPVESRFHPYLRQLSESAVTNTVCLQRASPPFSGPQQVDSSQMFRLTLGSDTEVQTQWEQHNYNVQCSYSELPVVPAETPQSHFQYYPSYMSTSPRQEDATSPYASEKHLLSQIHQRNNLQPLFPKPIYSYSILIFMALKNSETGSLPVSEIYSFMTENFPYFKTAPDGWKNSVRHNLSLNKSFEKLEGKHTNSSRKGCLWALNPAKVEKMQEELHKWRRKDPISVRRSMARPEDLDHLLGQMPKKFRSTPPYTRSASVCDTVATSSSQSPSRACRHPQYSCAPPLSQQSCLLSLNNTHCSDSLALYTPRDPQCTTDLHSESINFIETGKLPPVYNVTHRDDFSVGQRNLQDLHLEKDIYNVDLLNPSLNELHLKGNLWEKLQEDNLALHLQTATTPTYITSGRQADYDYYSCMDTILPPGENSTVACAGSL